MSILFVPRPQSCTITKLRNSDSIRNRKADIETKDRKPRHPVGIRAAYWLGAVYWTSFDADVEYNLTGPKRPEANKGDFALYGFIGVKVYFTVAPGCSSPIRRLTQAFVTLTVSSLRRA